MENWLQRTQILIGKENLQKLQDSTVMVFGCGGVGSYVVEGLVRSGIGHLVLFDADTISETNLNRQLIATTETIGESKVEVLKKRALSINPMIQIDTFSVFISEENIASYVEPFSNVSYLVDAVDTVRAKLGIIQYAKAHDIPVISSMGTGNKLDPTRFEIADIEKTSVCPLAKVMRKELRARHITKVKVLYSKEEPQQIEPDDVHTTASISFVPSVAGLIISGEVIKDICGLGKM